MSVCVDDNMMCNTLVDERVCSSSAATTKLCYNYVTSLMFNLQGSVIGGFLAQPASKYSALQFPFFCKYPYTLPCFVGAGMSIGSLIGRWNNP